jgi:hypothetical protein
MPTRKEIDELNLEAQQVVLKALIETTYPSSRLELAEAWAWLDNPNQPHGGGAGDVTVKQ